MRKIINEKEFINMMVNDWKRYFISEKGIASTINGVLHDPKYDHKIMIFFSNPIETPTGLYLGLANTKEMILTEAVLKPKLSDKDIAYMMNKFNWMLFEYDLADVIKILMSMDMEGIVHDKLIKAGLIKPTMKIIIPKN